MLKMIFFIVFTIIVLVWLITALMIENHRSADASRKLVAGGKEY